MERWWLRTDLGGKTADLSPEQGAIATMEKIMSAGKEESGKFLNIKNEGFENVQGANYYDGELVPW
jgi:hypothetical protein